MKIVRMQGYFFGAAVLLAPLSLLAQVPTATGSSAAQSQSGGQMASMNPMDSSLNGSAGADTQLMKDKMFVRKATEGGFAEVQFSQLATQKASSDDVKKLGQKLVDDRTILDNNMKPVADELGVRSPTKMAKVDQDEMAKLNGLSGSDFDKEYLTYMLNAHRKDMHDFHTEETQTTDPALKDAVESQTKVILGHLYMVNKLALANGVPGAHKGPPPSSTPAATPPSL
jgi:putative membrane protein